MSQADCLKKERPKKLVTFLERKFKLKFLVWVVGFFGGFWVFLNLQITKAIEVYFACVFPAVQTLELEQCQNPPFPQDLISAMEAFLQSHFEGNFQSPSYITNILNAPKYNFC